MITVITKRDGTIMFPVSATRPGTKFERQADNVIRLHPPAPKAEGGRDAE